MLGAYVGYTLIDRLGGAVGFWGALVLGRARSRRDRRAGRDVAAAPHLRRARTVPVARDLRRHAGGRRPRAADLGTERIAGAAGARVQGRGDAARQAVPELRPPPHRDRACCARPALAPVPAHDLGRAGARGDAGSRNGGGARRQPEMAVHQRVHARRLSRRDRRRARTATRGGEPQYGHPGDHGGAGRRRDRRARQRSRHLHRGDPGLRAQRVRHSRAARHLAGARVSRDGRRAGRPALGPLGTARGDRPRAGRRRHRALAPVRAARASPRRARLPRRRPAAARRRQLLARRRERGADLRALCREPAFPDRRRRPRLIRPCRVLRARLLRRRARAEGFRRRHGAGDSMRRRAGNRGRARRRLVLRAPHRRLFRDADARFRADRLVARVPVDRPNRRRQRPDRRLAERLGRLACAFLLAGADAREPRRDRPARHRVFTVRLCAARAARQPDARGDDRHRAPAGAMGRLRHRGRFRRTRGRPVRVPEGQRLSRQSRHSALDRRPRHGPPGRRRDGLRRRRRRGGLPLAVDLGHQPHRLFPPRHRRAHRRAGGAVSQGAGGAWQSWRARAGEEGA